MEDVVNFHALLPFPSDFVLLLIFHLLRKPCDLHHQLPQRLIFLRDLALIVHFPPLLQEVNCLVVLLKERCYPALEFLLLELKLKLVLLATQEESDIEFRQALADAMLDLLDEALDPPDEEQAVGDHDRAEEHEFGTFRKDDTGALLEIGV